MAKLNPQAIFRHNAESRRFVPSWIWFLLGLVCGLGLSALVLIKQWAPRLRTNPSPSVPSATPNTETATAPEKPKYDFYSVLPEMEVVIPDAEVKSAANVPTTNSTQGTSSSTAPRYVLQAGSFRTSADADALKARLTLMDVGAPVSVQPVNVNGIEYYRVRIGPFADLRSLDDVKRLLERNGIDAIALRENQP